MQQIKVFLNKKSKSSEGVVVKIQLSRISAKIWVTR